MDVQYRPSSLRNRSPRSYHERVRHEESYHFALGFHSAAPERSTQDARRTRIETQLLELLEEASRTMLPPGSDLQKLGDFYTAAQEPEAQDMRSLQEWFLRIEQATDLETISHAMRQAGLPAMGSCGLERDAYPKEAKRRAYQGHVARMLALTGMNPGRASMEAEKIVALEAAIAKDAPLSGTDASDWKAYLRWRIVDTFGPACIRFEAEQKRQQGAADRGKTLLAVLDPLLGRALANRWVDRFVSLRSRSKAADFLNRMRPAADHAALEIRPDDHLGNLLRLRACEATRREQPLPVMAMVDVLALLMQQIDLDTE